MRYARQLGDCVFAYSVIFMYVKVKFKINLS
jgi:hypothetical protein